MIEIKGVMKEFAKGERRVLAIEDFSLNVAEREFVAILGPSGCGKSTLLNMVAGFDSPTRGIVRVDGKEIAEPSPQRGVVFQEPALFPWFSVMENVVFGPKTQGQKAAGYRPRAEQILEQVGLRGFEGSYPAEPPAPSRSLSRWGCAASKAAIRRSYPAACANVSGSRECSSCSRRCC